MLYKEWKPFYKEISQDINLNFKDDTKASEILNNLLNKQKNLIDEEQLKKIIQNKEVIVFGAGTNLISSIKKNKNSSFFKKSLKISADGATTALLEEKIQPDIIVTDLDGNIPDQIKANNNGSIVVIHAHGDNIEKIQKIVVKFKGKIFATTQINPKKYNNLYNYGGFTDGDRAVYLSDHFQAKKIYLIGFDFQGKIGKHSYSTNKIIKRKKLLWCELLIKRLDNKKIIFL